MFRRQKKPRSSEQSPISVQTHRLFQVGVLVFIGYIVFANQDRVGRDEQKAEKSVTLAEEDVPGVSQLDITLGEGAPAKCGDKVTLHYAGFRSDGVMFKDTEQENAPVTLSLGSGYISRPLERAVIGMRAGGVRQVTIPAGIDNENIAVSSGEEVGFRVLLQSIVAQESVTEGLSLKSYDDLIGKGVMARCGDVAFIRYQAFEVDGRQIVPLSDSPVVFALGIGNLPEGLERGVLGMRVGGKRTLIIPPALLQKAEGGQASQGVKLPDDRAVIVEVILDQIS